MRDMQDVSGQHREARNAGLVVFADADGRFVVCERADPETPLNAEPLDTKADVTRFARGHLAKRVESADKAEVKLQAARGATVFNEQTFDDNAS